MPQQQNSIRNYAGLWIHCRNLEYIISLRIFLCVFFVFISNNFQLHLKDIFTEIPVQARAAMRPNLDAHWSAKKANSS